MRILSLALASTIAATVFTFGLNARATCTNDVDCPSPACGGQVCQWPSHTCVDAGSATQGADGWCGMDSDCKCFGAGATCAAPYCTFTLPKDGGATTQDGGSTGTGTGTGTTGTGTGTGTGTTGTGTGTGTGTTGTGTAPSPVSDSGVTVSDGGTSPSSSSSSGCSLAVPGRTGGLGAFAIAGLVGLVARRRRDRVGAA